MSDTPLSKEEEDFALRRMPFDLGVEVAKANKSYLPQEHQIIDWLWEKEVDLGWLGERCVQIYGLIEGDEIHDLRIMLGNNDITNEVPEKVICELISEIFEER